MYRGTLFLGPVLGALMVFYSCASGGSANPDATPKPSDAALIISDEPEYDYGSQAVNDTAEKIFTITKTGDSDATSVIGSGLSAPFSFKGGSYPGTGGTCGATVSANCTIVVIYSPVEAAAHTDDIEISYWDGTTTQTASRTVKGTGVAAGLLSISDGPSYSYGTKVVGTTTSKTFTVANLGVGNAINVTGEGLAVPFSFLDGDYPGTGGTCEETINAESTCTVVVSYAPVAAGSLNDSIVLSYDNGFSAKTVNRNVSGTGITPAVLTISDGGTYDYSSQNIQTTVEHVFTVAKTGVATATGVSGGGLDAPFAFKGGDYPGTGGTCGAVISANCTIVVTYSPVSIAAQNDTIEISYNNGIGVQTATRAVQGTGVSAVLPLYSEYGADWNDYVLKTDGNGECHGFNGQNGYDGCYHGGEKRAVYVPGVESCDGVSASDNLGAFDWTCDETTNPVRVISTGLKISKALSDLIDFETPAWKENFVTVNYEGGPFQTTSAVWWSNPVIEKNDGGVLGTAGTIYVVTADPGVNYSFGANQTALLIKPTVTIQGPGTGSEAGVVSADSRERIWLEGKIDATGDQFGVYWNTVRRSVLRNVTAQNPNVVAGAGIFVKVSSNLSVKNITMGGCERYGLSLANVSYSTFDTITVSNTTAATSAGIYLQDNWWAECIQNTFNHVRVYDSAQYGIDITKSQSNTFEDVIIANSASYGLYLVTDVGHNNFSDIKVTNAKGAGIYLNAAHENHFKNVISTSNGGDGVNVYSSIDNVFKDLIVANNTSHGLETGQTGDHNLFSNVISTNNGGTGLACYTSNNTFENLATYSNTNMEILLADSSNNRFTGLLKVDSDSACSVSGGTAPGLDNTTCTISGASDALLTNNANLSASVKGKVGVNDLENGSDTLGAATDMTTLDWINFDLFYRGWGRDNGAGFPNAAHQGYWGCNSVGHPTQVSCEGGGHTWKGDGRIWDWSLALADNVVRGVLEVPTGDDTIIHTWSNDSTSTFMRRASELIGDGIGDDDGLCESDEACLFTPNMGAYQGHGALQAADGYSDGALTGINLKEYETNGY